MMRDVTPRPWWRMPLIVSGVLVVPPFLGTAIFVQNYPGWIFLAAIPFIWAGWFLFVVSIRYTFSLIRIACQRAYFGELRKHGILHKADPAALVHGSAVFAEYEGLRKSGHLEPDPEKVCRMPVFGVFPERPAGQARFSLVGYAGKGHLLTVAPSRSGKGATQIVPNLLAWPGPAVITDIKGENHDITQRQRRKYGPVYALAPFRDASDRFNPMDELDHTAPDGWEIASLMAEMMIVSSGGKDAAFWEQESRSFLAGVIMYVACEEQGDRRTIGQVREYLSLAGEAHIALIEAMMVHEVPQIRRAATTWCQKAPNVQGGILATLNSQMNIWDSPKLMDMTSRSDFRFGELKANGCGTVYIIIPPDQIERMGPFVRLLVALALRAMMKVPNIPGNLPVTFFLDEFTALGNMQPIQQGLLYLAGYDVRLWMFVQDMASLANVYGDKGVESFVANAGARLFFGTNSFDTARRISDMAGRMTVLDGSFDSPRTLGRPLIAPDEVMKMGRNVGLLFIEGQPPVLLLLLPYYETGDFEGLYDRWEG